MVDDKKDIHEQTVFRRKEDLIPTDKDREPVFIIILGEEVGKVYRIKRDKPMIIGRAKDVDIVMNDIGISRKHAQIAFTGNGQLAIFDLNSTNGTYVNGERVSEQELADGDKIQIGSAAIIKFSYQDMLEESFQKNLYQSATKDALTEIYNKKFFIDAITKELSYSLRSDFPLSLIIFDIDHFKRINDTWGHQAGDHVLKKLARLIQEQIRKEDVFCRYGGEEFTLILKGKNAEHAILTAERLRKIVDAHKFSFEDKEIPLTISLGIATLTKEDKFPTPDDMIKEADKFLYQAKEAGRNRSEYKK
ncbi:MAG: GGDEF domain-containing protein [Pseudomonadota bacterium]